MHVPESRVSRRRFITASALSAAAFAAACNDSDGDRETPPTAPPDPTAAPTEAAAASPQALAPTPACADDDDATAAQTEGPYFTPDSPQRASLRDAGMSGAPLLVSGAVVSTQCAPVPRALLDFWQCDANGVYDNEGYTLRGHQFAGDDGSFSLETIMPGLYPGRTRHIHVKVQAPGRPVLTTQLYFPGEAANASDGIFDGSLVMDVRDGAAGREATFTFVLDV